MKFDVQDETDNSELDRPKQNQFLQENVSLNMNRYQKFPQISNNFVKFEDNSYRNRNFSKQTSQNELHQNPNTPSNINSSS